jgi:hypothetical protein
VCPESVAVLDASKCFVCSVQKLKVLILNGPPSAGIEAVAQGLAKAHDAEVLSAYAATLSRNPRLIVPDLGFRAELDLLINAGFELLLIHVIRQGYTFQGCSRGYVDHPDVDAVTINYETGLFDISFIAYLFFELQVKQE